MYVYLTLSVPGGNKKLQAMTVIVSGILLFTPTLFQLVLGAESISDWLTSVLPWSILVAIAGTCLLNKLTCLFWLSIDKIEYLFV